MFYIHNGGFFIVRFHKSTTTNLNYLHHCAKYNDGNGIFDLFKTYVDNNFQDILRMRFYIGVFETWCIDSPQNKFNWVVFRKSDWYRLQREQPLHSDNNFIDFYNRYINEIFVSLIAQHLSVNPECSSGSTIINIKNICFVMIEEKEETIIREFIRKEIELSLERILRRFI